MSTFESRQKASDVFVKSFISGGFAGLTVDVSLYPIDTIKTRLQSEQGFIKAGGFNGIYKGIGAVLVGSIPASALFFVSYEVSKELMETQVQKKYHPVVHMVAACFGEVGACIVRVPTDIVKQRRQTGSTNSNILAEAYRSEGLFRGVFRGFASTVMRDLPFSLIQMPIWELLKKSMANSHYDLGYFQSAISGAIAGGIAAAATTPLDLAKTRIMLAKSGTTQEELKVFHILRNIYREKGFFALYTGIVPRTTAFMIGGFIFFGAYDYFGKFYDGLNKLV